MSESDAPVTSKQSKLKIEDVPTFQYEYILFHEYMKERVKEEEDYIASLTRNSVGLSDQLKVQADAMLHLAKIDLIKVMMIARASNDASYFDGLTRANFEVMYIHMDKEIDALTHMCGVGADKAHEKKEAENFKRKLNNRLDDIKKQETKA